MDPAAERTLAGLRERDPGAFDDVYARWRPRLHAFLARQCGDRSLAEDLLQETFVRLAERAASLRPDTDLGAWLFTVARNLAASQGRWRRFTAGVMGALRLTPGAAPLPGPFERLAATESARRLEEALARLPPRDREVLLLVGGEGLDAATAAQVVGIRPEALRQRLSRARGKLAAALGAESGAPEPLLNAGEKR